MKNGPGLKVSGTLGGNTAYYACTDWACGVNKHSRISGFKPQSMPFSRWRTTVSLCHSALLVNHCSLTLGIKLVQSVLKCFSSYTRHPKDKERMYYPTRGVSEDAGWQTGRCRIQWSRAASGSPITKVICLTTPWGHQLGGKVKGCPKVKHRKHRKWQLLTPHSAHTLSTWYLSWVQEGHMKINDCVTVWLSLPDPAAWQHIAQLRKQNVSHTSCFFTLLAEHNMVDFLLVMWSHINVYGDTDC